MYQLSHKPFYVFGNKFGNDLHIYTYNIHDYHSKPDHCLACCEGTAGVVCCGDPTEPLNESASDGVSANVQRAVGCATNERRCQRGQRQGSADAVRGPPRCRAVVRSSIKSKTGKGESTHSTGPATRVPRACVLGVHVARKDYDLEKQRGTGITRPIRLRPRSCWS